jgi:pimeloyl-ACP methyl ester carboxylesterase
VSEETLDLEDRLEWNDRQIAWGRTGTGPPVVFCHGTPFSSAVWAPFADALSRDFTVYLWDMPGYGRSSKHPQHRVDFGVHAEAFGAILDHWDLDSPQVIAHDFGGAVALRSHLIDGRRFASLMLVDVVAIPPSGSAFFKFVHDNPDLLGQLPGYIHEAIVRTYIQNATRHPLRRDVLDELTSPWLGEEGQPAFYRQIADYDERFLEENERRLQEFAIPVRIVWAANDAWIPTTMAERLRDLIPNAEMALIPNAGHLVHYDAPAALMGEVRAWLDRHVDRR